jgi:hypothetical protein
VDVRVDETGEDHEVARIDELATRRDVVIRGNALYPTVRDVDARVADARGRDHPPAPNEEIGSVHGDIVSPPRGHTLPAMGGATCIT